MEQRMQQNNDELNVFERILRRIVIILRSIYITTFLFFKNLPAMVVNRWQRYQNERKRIPKRKTKNRVYILIGYTTKAKVDKRYKSVKIQKIVRAALLFGILVICCVLAYRAVNPNLDFDAYKQMFGIEEMDELTTADPFDFQHFGDNTTGTTSSSQV